MSIPYDLQYECDQVVAQYCHTHDLAIFIRRIFEIQRRRENWAYGKYLLDLLQRFFVIPICPCYHFLHRIHTKTLSNQDLEHYHCPCQRRNVEIPDISQEAFYQNQESVQESRETGIITRVDITYPESINKYYYLELLNPADEDQIPDERFMHEINKYYSCISCHFLNYHHDIYQTSHLNMLAPYLNTHRLEASLIDMPK